ncbi:XkdX family protein [Lacrimispora sp. JR3]
MFDTLMWLYDGGKGPLTVPMLANAVIKKWISEDQKKEIMATKN